VIRTPIRTPVANAYTERFVQTVRRERLDWLMITNERHALDPFCLTVTRIGIKKTPHVAVA
jgi:hypothetical protein